MNPFCKHPKEVEMTYFEHMKFALRLSGIFALLSIASLTHAIFPFLFTKTASKLIEELHMELSKRKAADECCCCKSKECKCEECKCEHKKCACCSEKK